VTRVRIPAAAIFFGLFFHKLFTRLGIRLGLGLGLVIFGVRDSFSILSLRCYSTAGRLVVSLGGRLPACYTRRFINGVNFFNCDLFRKELMLIIRQLYHKHNMTLIVSLYSRIGMLMSLKLPNYICFLQSSFHFLPLAFPHFTNTRITHCRMHDSACRLTSLPPFPFHPPSPSHHIPYRIIIRVKAGHQKNIFGSIITT